MLARLHHALEVGGGDLVEFERRNLALAHPSADGDSEADGEHAKFAVRPAPPAAVVRRNALRSMDALPVSPAYLSRNRFTGLEHRAGAYSSPRRSAGTAWSAGLRPAQRPVGPRAARTPFCGTARQARERRPLVGTAARRAAGGSSPPAFTGRGYGARSAVRDIGHSNVRITPNAGVQPETATVPEIGVRPAARLRRAVPAGGRRSKPSPRPRSGGDTRFSLSRVICATAVHAGRGTVPEIGARPPPAYGGLWRSEDRRSQPYPRFCAIGYPPAVQPPAGRSNQTCTCPVPTAFSYSENSRPGAVQSAPPAALAAIR